MAANHSVQFVITPDADFRVQVVAAALPALPLTDEERRRVCARLAPPIAPESLNALPQPPELWRRFDEGDCSFLARGQWESDGRLTFNVEIWTEPSNEPEERFGGDSDAWTNAATAEPALAAQLLSCLYAVSVAGSTLVLGFDPGDPQQQQNATLLTAFARAALPTPLRRYCSVILPLGAPETLVQELGARVVAYTTRPGNELGAAWGLAGQQRGLLFSMKEGLTSGSKPDAGCQAYAEAALRMAQRGPRAVLRFAHKAGLLGDEAARRPDLLPLPQIQRLVEAVDAPQQMTALLDEWQAAPKPDEFSALLEPDDFGPVSNAALTKLAGAMNPPFAGGKLQAKAMLALAGRPPGSVSASALLTGSPDDPAALTHAIRLVRSGLVTAELPAEWRAPIAAQLSGGTLVQALSKTLAEGAAARELSLALLDRAREEPNPVLADALLAAKRSGQLNDLALALKAEQAYNASAHGDLGLLEALLKQCNWTLNPTQRGQVVRAALSRHGRAVGPSLLFADGRLRVPDEWVPEIVDGLSGLPAPDRAELRTEEWAALWAAASSRPELAKRLAPLLDERMAQSTQALTKALLREDAWVAWKSASQAPAAVRDQAAVAWLAGRGPRKPFLEEWKAAIEGLKTLDAENLRKLETAAGKSRELFDAIPYFEAEQTADLIRLAPDDGTRALWAQLLDRFPLTDPYRSLDESAESYVLAAGSVGDEVADARRRALQLAAAGDLQGAREHWSAFAQLSDTGRLAAAAIGALRGGDLQANCWTELGALPAREAVSALLDFVRKRLTAPETMGLAGPLLKVFGQRPNWLESQGEGVPALELLATVESSLGVVVPAMQVARLAAARGYAGRADWWRRLAAQAHGCPRHDGRPNPLESWESTRAFLYVRAATLPEPAAKLFRNALEPEDDAVAGVGTDAGPWPEATTR